ncbi:hypothetical protein MKW94_001746 [Papaver nudicaule]|uniref:FAR1 domain-containing protein n=1 Tax=Papaver nudicaule TaxID=74823 RepID=A0AA41V450_PAPNU|nr:hypothetical protein [Papaver nudicaule]
MYHFYNQYARRIGFSIRKGTVKRSKDDKIRKRVILCSKQGFKERHGKGTPQKARPDMRTGCMARIQCIAKGHEFVVTKFIEEHNHELVNSTEAHLLRSQRKILPQQVKYMESLRSGGCGPTQVFTIMSNELGGSRHLNFTQTDLQNQFQKRRREIYKKGDVQGAYNYFQNMKKDNPSFFSEIQVDENGRTCNLFWADAQARIDYGFFGDVICFDTTFRTNRYGMPCAPFVGEDEEHTILSGNLTLERKNVQEPKSKRKYTKKTTQKGPVLSDDEEYLQSLIDGMRSHNPKILTDVVERIENVAPDGHCGFRACAEMLGLSAEDGWKTVKNKMEKELTIYGDMYIPIIGGKKEYNDVLKRIKYKGGRATPSFWMVLPSMGYIFASAFNCIFSSYSNTNMGSTTWLPLRTPPPEDFKVVTILNLDNIHFVKAILKPDAPLPPVVSGWGSICDEKALEWAPHMEMLHRGWENIEQNQHGQVDRVIEAIDLDEP